MSGEGGCDVFKLFEDFMTSFTLVCVFISRVTILLEFQFS